jgi:nucleoside phosphorylase
MAREIPQGKAEEEAGPQVSIARLPVTGRELFGREKELAWLDGCWAEGVHLATLVAFGGVGKSALVNRWLADLRDDGWRGAERVFGWSFYSQGTSEHRASSDQFFAVALREFGDMDAAPSSQWEKGERLAKLVRRERAILVLDGLEPLQWGPGVQEGRLKDQAMEALLKELGAQSRGMCLVTTRIKVAELDGWAGAKVQERDLGGLSDAAGAELLRARKAKGTEEELRQASRDYEGHGLALTLLASYAHKAHRGDIRKRDRVALLDGKPAQRMFATYEKWFAGKPEVGVLRVLGLFDRPAPEDELAVLRAQSRIPGLTSFLYGAGPHAWDRAVATLRDVRLIVGGSEEREALDAHPLVREYFGEQLKKAHPAGWREGHRRLYEFLKGKAKPLPETIEEMAPLYAAVVHGCLAGKNQEALDEVLRKCINRGDEFFSTKKLGAFGSYAAVLSTFFEPPWDRLAPGLSEPAQAWVLNDTGFALRALGRLPEATDLLRRSLGQCVALKDWKEAAIRASNLGELLKTRGQLGEADAVAWEGVAHADRCGEAFRRLVNRTTLAAALHALGRRDEASALFAEAERIQKEDQPAYPRLYSLPGFLYCDLLLDQGREAEVLARATQALKWAEPQGTLLLDVALDHLTLGRAHYLASRTSALHKTEHHAEQAASHLQQAVDGLRRAGDQSSLPLGLLARASLRIFTHDLPAVRHDLDEALALATRCGMCLDEADAHLGFAHLALAEHDPAAARHHLAAARSIITATEYHRRDAELATLEAEAEAMSAEISRQARQAGRQERKEEESRREPSDPSRSSRALAPLRETPASAPTSPVTATEPPSALRITPMSNQPSVDFLLVTALEEERDALLSKLEGVAKLDRDGSGAHTYYEARVTTRRKDGAAYRVIVTSLSGMGPAKAAIKAGAIVQRWRPAHVLMIGIAGGVEGEVAPGDVMVASQVADYTLGKVRDGSAREERWVVYPADADLFDASSNFPTGWEGLVKEPHPEGGQPRRHFGVIASGGDVVASPEVVAAYRADWPKLIGLEMEGAGMAAGLHDDIHRPRFLMVRGVSDLANGADNAGTKKRWRRYACHAAAAYAVGLLQDGPVLAAQNPR